MGQVVLLGPSRVLRWSHANSFTKVAPQPALIVQQVSKPRPENWPRPDPNPSTNLLTRALGGHRSLVDDKIAVGEAGKDFKKLASTVLETPGPAAKKAAAKAQAAVKDTVAKVCWVLADRIGSTLHDTSCCGRTGANKLSVCICRGLCRWQLNSSA